MELSLSYSLMLHSLCFRQGQDAFDSNIGLKYGKGIVKNVKMFQMVDDD